jgi:hypothetical protein
MRTRPVHVEIDVIIYATFNAREKSTPITPLAR